MLTLEKNLSFSSVTECFLPRSLPLLENRVLVDEICSRPEVASFIDEFGLELGLSLPFTLPFCHMVDLREDYAEDVRFRCNELYKRNKKFSRYVYPANIRSLSLWEQGDN